MVEEKVACARKAPAGFYWELTEAKKFDKHVVRCSAKLHKNINQENPGGTPSGNEPSAAQPAAAAAPSVDLGCRYDT